jgi:hypothetical protein
MADDRVKAIEKPKLEGKDFLNQVLVWKNNSENQLKAKNARWAKNMKQVNGQFEETEIKRSKVRNRSKIYWRKTWASNQRLLASLYQAFLKEPESVKIEGRMGTDNDVQRGKVLTEMVKYRRDILLRKRGLFRKLMWALMDIVNLSDTIGKWHWNLERDEPDFVTYSPDRVFPDMQSNLKEEMRYWIFESFLTKQELEEAGYDNLTDIKASAIIQSPLEMAKQEASNLDKPHVSDDYNSNYYPSDGSGESASKEPPPLYQVWEILYKENDVVYYAVHNSNHAVLKEAEATPFEIYPVVHGSCLLISHELLGEGFPEPQEGPQRSANDTLNTRKDAVHLSLMPHRYVSRYGGVDIDSLVNARVGAITLMDDINAVKEEEKRDITGRAYMEVDSDDMMMQEMTAVTQQRQGFPGQPGEKATVANIAYQESGTKLDLYIGIIAQTFFHDFYGILAYMIQKFETDETVFRVANAKFPDQDIVFDIDSFEADYIVKVGTPSINKNMEAQQAMLAMQQATLANQVTLGLAQAGVLPPQGATIFDVAKFTTELLPNIGYKNVKDYLVTIGNAPPQQQGGGTQTAQGVAGAIQPQLSQGEVITGGLQPVG